MQPGEFLLSISVAALYQNAVRARVTTDLPLLPSLRLLPRCGDINEGDGVTGKSSPPGARQQWASPPAVHHEQIPGGEGGSVACNKDPIVRDKRRECPRDNVCAGGGGGIPQSASWGRRLRHRGGRIIHARPSLPAAVERRGRR